MNTRAPYTAVILSGGKNSRMGGHNKAFLTLGGERFMDLILDTLSPLFNEIIISTREPELYREWHLKTATDIFDIRTPLAGIHAALSGMTNDYAFVTTCDTPLIKKEAVKILADTITPDTDVIVPFSGTYFQPLCAVYSKRCLPFIEKMLVQKKVKVDLLFDNVKVKKIDYTAFEAVDPHLDSFFNINTPDEMAEAQIRFNRSTAKSET
jgi:molybdopterin-guanine dinucleotide biosynthesis protein A